MRFCAFRPASRPNPALGLSRRPGRGRHASRPERPSSKAGPIRRARRGSAFQETHQRSGDRDRRRRRDGLGAVRRSRRRQGRHCGDDHFDLVRENGAWNDHEPHLFVTRHGLSERSDQVAPHRQSRRDRLPHHPHRAASSASARSRSIRTPTPRRCTCARRTRRCTSARRRRAKAICVGDKIIAAAQGDRRRGDPSRLRLPLARMPTSRRR